MSNDAQVRKARIIFGIGGLAALVAVLIAINTLGKDEPAMTAPVVAATSTPTQTPAATPKPMASYKLDEKVTAGNFAIVASSPKVTTELKSDFTREKTEDQFVVVKVAITNNDDRARDVSTNMFKLTDGNGKSYEAYGKSVGVEGDEFLFYETINPGLTRSRSVAFETPKGISGLKLVVDSGVALAGGEKVAIDLGQ